MENDNIKCDLNKVEKEAYLYEHIIKDIQNEILVNYSCMLSWSAELSYKELTKYHLKSLLFLNSKERLKKLKMMDECYYDNSSSSSIKSFSQKIDIKLWRLITNPAFYMRYLCKLKEKIKCNLIYKPIAYMLYFYIRFTLLF